MKKIFLIAVFVSAALLSRSQNVNEEMKLIRNAYLNNKELSFDVEVYSYQNKNDKTPELLSKGYMRKKEENYYSKFQGTELLIMGEKAVIVDNEEKKMEYYNYKLGKQKIPKQFDMNMDSLITKSDSVVMRTTVGETKHFTIYSKKGYIRQTELYVNTKTSLVEHLLYYYVASNDDFQIEVDRVEVFYKNIKTQNTDTSDFNFNKYFILSRSTILPVGKYQKYAATFYNSKS